MHFFGKKELKIIKLFEEHLEAVETTVKEMLRLIGNVGSERDEIMKMAENVRSAESKADALRREMESEMYLGAFLPNFRGDLLGIVESIDVVANKAEVVADEIDLQKMRIPGELIDDLLKLSDMSLKTFQATAEAARLMFTDLEKSNEYVALAEEKEHEGDQIERTLIRRLFDLEMDLAEKILLKKLIKKISDIADHSENVSDRIQIVIFKRRV